MRLRSLFFAAALALGAFDDARAALEFSAYLTSGNSSQFVLKDLDTGKQSGWLAIGDSFRGHVVLTFDRKQETLTLIQGGESIVLPLKVAQIKDGNVDESSMADIKVTISNEGAFLLGNKALNQLELIEHFEGLVRSGKQISLTIQPPTISTPRNAESTRKVMNSFRVAGARGPMVVVKATPAR